MTSDKTPVRCRVWAHENTDGFYHRCHAEFRGLAGHIYPRDEIKNKLETTPIFIPGTNGVWELLACEPANHDGSPCKDCPYRFWKGHSHFYDLESQRRALREAGYGRKKDE